MSGSFVLAAATLTQRNVNRQERLKDERSLRNARRERLARSYAVVLTVLQAERYAATNLLDPLPSQGTDAARPHVAERLDPLLPDLERSLVELRLESGGQDLVQRTQETLALLFYLEAQHSVAQARLGEEYAVKADEAKRKLDALVNDTEQMMREQMQALDQPIG